MFTFTPMTDADAAQVAGWRYEGIYAFYNMDQDPDDLAELLDPAARADGYRSVLDDHGSLVGFFCFQPEGDAVEIGLGLRPDLTGRGLGLAFLEAGVAYARDAFGAASFRLAVATFNERAIRLYERAGFRRVRVFTQQTNGGTYEFLEMAK